MLFVYINFVSLHTLITQSQFKKKKRCNQKTAHLATEQERQLTTGKRVERTKRDFRFSICAPWSTDVPVVLLNHYNVQNPYSF